MNPTQRQCGFTLIELSIVLVIIGLIVGGILVGRDLIIAAEIRKTISEVSSISTAVNTFRQKYNCIPGDCANATALGFTNNGNGDGRIQSLLNNVNGWVDGEELYFWPHLISAQLLGFNLSEPGYNIGHTGPWIAGRNFPLSSYGHNSLYTVAYMDPTTRYVGWGGSAGGTFADQFAPMDYGNAIIIGASTPSVSGDAPFIDGVDAPDAYAIDSKIDDGYPLTGNVLGSLDGGLACTVSYGSTPPTQPIAYDIKKVGLFVVDYSCEVIFKNAF